jgi:hypothetical protein
MAYRIRHRQFVGTRTVVDIIHIAVIVDNHQRHVTPTGIREGDRCAFGDVDDAGTVERIPIHPNDVLLIDRRGCSIAVQLVDATCLLDDAGVFKVCLCPIKIVYIDNYLCISLSRRCTNTNKASGERRAIGIVFMRFDLLLVLRC